MIKVQRPAKPDILEKKAVGWTKALIQATSTENKKKAAHKYTHPKIKASLVAMFHGKCAYCESKITHIDYGHIEHFKPISKYRESAFDWDNLLLACGRCNGAEHKGDNFPDAAEWGPLINPCKDEPAEHFTFLFDVHAQLATVIGKTLRGITTENLLGLNRHELRTHRSGLVRKLYVLSSMAGVMPEARALLEEAKQADAEYAAFAREL